MGDQAVPAGRESELPLTEGQEHNMLRLQSPLPERYVDATPDQLADWIAAAKATLGSRVFILGHHYQRDEVMRWADARGDSFGLSRLAADPHDAEDSVTSVDHVMAATSGRPS